MGRNSSLQGAITAEQVCEFFRIQLTQKVGGGGVRANRISDSVDLIFFFLKPQIFTTESRDYFQAWDGSMYSC